MKILHLDFDDLESPTAGGQAVRTFEINRRLAKKGHDITVVTLPYAGSVNKTKEGIKYERAGIKKYPFSLISYFFSVRSIIRKHTFDLVVEDNISPFTFGFSPLFTKKPVISQVQSFHGLHASKKYHLPFWMIEKYGAKFYKNFIVLTREMQKEILTLNGKANIKIIPNGIDKVPGISKTDKKYFLFLGRIDFDYKGIDYLLNIMEHLQKTRPELKLIIAGYGLEEGKLKSLIRGKDLKNTEFIGKVGGEKKEKLLGECTALVMPSRYETFGITMLEAAKHGKPTVCFDIPNLKEHMESKIGITVPHFNTTKFVESMIELHDNKEETEKLGRNAHEWAKKYLWDTIADEQEKFYYTCSEAKCARLP